MADLTLHDNTTRGGFAHALKSFFTGLFEGLVSMGESSSRYRRLQTLSSLSDAQLAYRGLKREDIVHHVFADVYYT